LPDPVDEHRISTLGPHGISLFLDSWNISSPSTHNPSLLRGYIGDPEGRLGGSTPIESSDFLNGGFA